jgi:hypothetical protein
LMCNNVNWPNKTECNAKGCQRPRSEVDGGAPEGAGQGGGGVQREPPDGAWTCPTCQNVNWPTRQSCNRRSCGLPRPEGV